VHEQKGKLLKIRPEDEDYVKQRTAELAAKAELSSEKTVKDVGQEMTRSWKKWKEMIWMKWLVVNMQQKLFKKRSKVNVGMATMETSVIDGGPYPS